MYEYMKYIGIYSADFLIIILLYYDSSEKHILFNHLHIYVTVNLRNQLFPGIPKTFRESGESLKCIEIPRNL